MRLFLAYPLLAACALAQSPRAFFVSNIDVFDGTRMLRGVSVAVADGKITAVGKSIPADVMAIIFSSGPDPGPFSFEIDDIRLQ